MANSYHNFEKFTKTREKSQKNKEKDGNPYRNERKNNAKQYSA
jgi:hypothetical protein